MWRRLPYTKSSQNMYKATGTYFKFVVELLVLIQRLFQWMKVLMITLISTRSFFTYSFSSSSSNSSTSSSSSSSSSNSSSSISNRSSSSSSSSSSSCSSNCCRCSNGIISRSLYSLKPSGFILLF